MLAAVDLPADSAERFPHQFSGGQRQRISIARALICKPRVLVADEPVSALDVSVRAQVLNLLSDLVDQYQLTLVFVSHDLGVVRHICDNVVVMRSAARSWRAGARSRSTSGRSTSTPAHWWVPPCPCELKWPPGKRPCSTRQSSTQGRLASPQGTPRAVNEVKESALWPPRFPPTCIFSAPGISARRTRRSELSPVEVCAAVIEPHRGARAGAQRALSSSNPEEALRDARASEARWSTGSPLSALDGVPTTVKENIARAGVPMPGGTALPGPRVPAANAPITDRILEGGGVIMGSTTMPDWGMLSSGVSSLHGITRSAWNPAWTTGGSSAGAGAAAAAGYGPLHVGTDIGGSIRLPGTWQGLVTIKPSAGLSTAGRALYRPGRRPDGPHGQRTLRSS